MRFLLMRYKHFVVLAFIVSVIGVPLVAVVPAARNVSQTKETITRVQEQLRGVREAVSQMEELTRSGAGPEVSMSELDATQLMPAFLEQVALFGKKHGVDVYHVTPEGTMDPLPVTGPDGKATTYLRQRVRIRSTSTYTGLGNFLNDLEGGPLAVVVERIEIRKTSEGGTRLDVGLLISAFVKG